MIAGSRRSIAQPGAKQCARFNTPHQRAAGKQLHDQETPTEDAFIVLQVDDPRRGKSLGVNHALHGSLSARELRWSIAREEPQHEWRRPLGHIGSEAENVVLREVAARQPARRRPVAEVAASEAIAQKREKRWRQVRVVRDRAATLTLVDETVVVTSVTWRFRRSGAVTAVITSRRQ